MEHQIAISDDLSEIVLHTLGRPVQATITTMLEKIAERFGAFGCGLWEVSPNANLKLEIPSGFLLTVGAWWKSKELFALDDVPLHDSPTARAALDGKPVNIPDIRKPEGGAKREHPFWEKNKIRSMCAVPLQFLDKTPGALNIYRAENANGAVVPFTNGEQERLEAIARLVPGLYRAVREKIGLELVSDIEQLLRTTESEKRQKGTGLRSRLKYKEVVRLLGRVCERVAEAYDCIETSLFLEDTENNVEPEYKCVATTSKKCVARKTSYHAEKDAESFTGWVLSNREPIWVPDLARLDAYRDYLKRQYRGLNRFDGTEDTQDARRLFRLKKSASVPPLSLMAVPVFGAEDWFGGTDLRGVLRCHIAKSGPFYFGEREAGLLQLVGAQIGQWWAQWRADEEMARENAGWKIMIRVLGELNDFVRIQLEQANPDEGAIFREALNAAEKAMEGAELNSIRIYEPSEKVLKFAHFSPSAQTELRQSRVPKNAIAPDPVVPGSKAAGVKVFRTSQIFVHHNVLKRRNYSPIFPDVRGMITVPIGVAGENIGVLDLRWTERPIPSYAPQAAQLLGQQLGIYHQLMLLIAEQRSSVAKAEKQKNEETRAFEDFAHQIKSPLMQAMLRAQTAFEMSDSLDERRRLLMVRGLIRRAGRVAMSMRLLADLSHGRPIVPKRRPIDRDVLVKKLIELADDTQLHVQSRNMSFTVIRESFSNFHLRGFQADFDLLEQMISNLLDNAAKYGFKETTAVISAGLTKTDRLYLSVTNKGVPFGAGETEKCKERGYRSIHARLTSAEGQGIGLWLVDQIMRFHGGELLIESPNSNGITEVRLVFPKS